MFFSNFPTFIEVIAPLQKFFPVENLVQRATVDVVLGYLVIAGLHSVSADALPVHACLASWIVGLPVLEKRSFFPIPPIALDSSRIVIVVLQSRQR